MAATRDLLTKFEHDRDILLGNGFGLADFFYLPLRVARVLGWSAAAAMMFAPEDPRGAEADELLGSILTALLETYGGSIVAMGDAQAPCWAVCLSRAIAVGLTDQAEQLLGLLFTSLLGCEGNVARSDIPDDQILTYLLARAGNNFSQVGNLAERPCESTTVILWAAALCGLDEVFDRNLWELDGHHFMAHLNGNYAGFGKWMMEGGENPVWRVGGDIYQIRDILRHLPECLPCPPTLVLAAGAVLASLTYPDRVPWFVISTLSGSRPPVNESRSRQ